MKKIKELQNNKAFKISFTIVKWFLTIIVALMLIIIMIQRIFNNNVSIGGYRVFAVVSESMLPVYEIGDVLISKEEEPSKIKIGDDLVYQGMEGDFAGRIITHRVISTFNEEGKYSYLTKGVNNELTDPRVNEEQVYGIITHKLVVFSFLGQIMSTAIGYFTLFVIASLLLSYQIVKAFFIKDDENEEDN